MTVTTETPLGQVRALGSAHAGGHHWGQERAISVATLVLFVWFGVSLFRLPAFDQATVAQWLHAPLATVPMLLLIVVTFQHLRMGLIVVVEDYVHEEGTRFGWVMLINFASVFAAALALFCVLKIALSPAA